MRMKWAVGMLSVALCWGFGTGLAVAQSLSFDNPTVDGGTLTYDGLGGPAIATDVIFQALIGVSTPLNPGVQLLCFPANCLLDFTSGTLPAGNLEGPPIWSFEGGGTISMTGGLNTAADGSGVQVLPAGSIIITSGSFNDPAVVLGVGNDVQFTGSGTDTKNATLLAFYGLANPLQFVTTELSLNFAVIDTTTGAFTATVTDSDFQNVGTLAVVPMPPTGLLVGLGLLLMGGAAALRRFV
jgi:hypothetical protein